MGKNTYEKGWMAEAVALIFLHLKGYRRVAWRFASHVGEIDLILRRGNTWVAVEVKYRESLAAGLESISSTQQRRILRAFEAFLAARNITAPCRIDVIIIRPWRLPYHIQNAWGG